MNIDDFWCRAFLAAMGGEYAGHTRWENHGAPAAYCERAADAALDVAKRRGMIADAMPGNDLPADHPRQAPTLERVEFTAEQADHGMWVLSAPELGGSIWATSGRESIDYNGAIVRIKWGETSPPKPIEVWIERPAASSPAPPGMSDAEVAAEFYRRFQPSRVDLGPMADDATYAEIDGGNWRSGWLATDSGMTEHPAGEPGFVAAVLRARELVRKGGGS